MLFEDVANVGLLTSLDLFAIAINIFYMIIIWKRTPTPLSTYSALLLHMACTDLLTSTSSLMCCHSAESATEFRVVLTYLGPCTLLNERWCHFFLAAHAHAIAHSVLLLLLSFLTRLWTLGAMTIGQTVRYNRIRAAAQAAISLFVLLNMPIGDNLVGRSSFAVLVLIYVVGFVAIVDARRKLSVRISSLSGADSRSHKQIYNSLIAQMVLPSAFVIATTFWFLDVIGLIHSSVLHRSIIFSTSLFPLISPLINMYYIPPYRRYLKSIISPSTRIFSLNNIQQSDDRF